MWSVVVIVFASSCVAAQDPSSPFCDVGWSYDPLSGSCFKGYSGEWTFDEAHQLCMDEGDGSDLASVTSCAIQNYINDNVMITTSYWIGLNDPNGARQYQWTDGSPVNFFNWASGEPNAIVERTCVEVRPDGQWNDHRCTTKRGYLCKKPSDLVGLWPLQEAHGGNDTSPEENNLILNEVTFPDDDVTPWPSPAAMFQGTATSYGHIQQGQNLDVKSFSWMARVYRNRDIGYEYLFHWMDGNGGRGVSIFLYYGVLTSYIYIPDCPVYYAHHPATLPVKTWSTLAVTYDFPTNTLTVWQDGVSEVSTRTPCGTRIKTSQQLYIGIRHDNAMPFQGRLSCMSLFNAVVDYDVMNAVTMQQCGGE